MEPRNIPWWRDLEAWFIAFALAVFMSASFDAHADFASVSRWIGHEPTCDGAGIACVGAQVAPPGCTFSGSTLTTPSGFGGGVFTMTYSGSPGGNCGGATRMENYPRTCPAGADIVASSPSHCTCPSPMTEGGAVSPYTASCVGLCDATINQTQTLQFLAGWDTNADRIVDVLGPKMSPPAPGLYPPTVNFSGCQYNIKSPLNLTCYAYVSAPTKIYCDVDYVGDGVEVTGGTAPDELTTANPCPGGYSYGTVNGIGRCLASGSAQAPSSVPQTTTTNNNTVNNGNGTSTTTSTKTGSGGTTTTTTVRDNTTGAVISETVTGPADQSDMSKFCVENPNSPLCKVAAWGGSCSSYTCEGDAILCAISRQQHDYACQFDASAEATFYRGGAGDMPTAQQAADALNKSGAKDINVNTIFQSNQGQVNSIAAACPAPREVTIFGEVVEIKFDQLCTLADVIKLFLMAAAMVIAGRILLGGA